MPLQVAEIGSGLFFVIGPRTNWCLIEENGAITLVDAAWPRDFPLVEESLLQIGAGPDDVEAVVLTHAHPDHVGVAERLRADHGAAVLTHDAEVGHATGRYHEHVRTIDILARIWRPSVFVFALNSIYHGFLFRSAVLDVEGFGEHPLDVPGRLTPIPTPGHTRGHCSFHLPDHGVVITGDALVSQNILTDVPGPRLMPRIFSHDWRQAAASLDNLEGLDADLLLSGHGPAMEMTPARAVQVARQRLAEDRWWDR